MEQFIKKLNITKTFSGFINGLTLSHLGLFGVLAFIPFDLMFVAEKNANIWGFLMLLAVIPWALILYPKISSEKRIYVKNAVLGGVLLTAGINILVFLRFSQQNQEPWLIQGGWFMREYGYVWAIHLAFLLLILSFQWMDRRERRDRMVRLPEPILSEQDTSNTSLPSDYQRKTDFYGGLVFGLVLISLWLYFYRSGTLFRVFLGNFILCGVGIGGYVTYKIFKKNNDNRLITQTPHSQYQLKNPAVLYFAIIGTLAVIGILIHLLNLTVDIPYFPAINTNHWIFPWSQFFIIGLVMITILSGFIIFARDYIRHSSWKNYSKLIRTIATTFKTLQVLGLFLVFGLGLYIFEFVLYVPEMLAKTAIFSLAGVLLLILIEHGIRQVNRPLITRSIRLGIILVMIGLLWINFSLVNRDLQKNGFNSENPFVDIIFPFEYLFSLPNLLINGLVFGYFTGKGYAYISHQNRRTTEEQRIHKEKSIFGHKSIVLFLGLILTIVGGFLIGLSSLIINVEGGKPSLAIFPSSFIITIFQIIFIVNIIFFIAQFIFQYLDEQKQQKQEKPNEQRSTSNKKTPKQQRNTSPKSTSIEMSAKKVRNIWVATGILVLIIGSGFGVGIPLQYSATQERPILAVRKNEYYIWAANASERFNPDSTIALGSSPHLSDLEFSVARNEYHAFQLGWRIQQNSLKNVSYAFSDFQLTTNSNIIVENENFQIRYEEWGYNNQFIDKLVPFEYMNLNGPASHLFWVNVKVPLNATTGLYEGNLQLNFESNQESRSEIFPIRMNVWNFSIPTMKHIRTNIGDNDVPENLDDPLLENYLDHRFNMYAEKIDGTDNYDYFIENPDQTCYINKTTGDWIFNWTYWDTQIEKKIAGGMNGIRMDYKVCGDCNLGRSLLITNDTQNQWFQTWLQEVESHLELKGWLNICYFYFVDEFTLFIPNDYERTEYYNLVRDQLASMKLAAPKIRIAVIAPPNNDLRQIEPYVDIYCPLLYDRNQENWDRIMEEGKELWYYTCVGPFAPYPNNHLYNELYQGRLLMWNAWYYQVSGYLFWRSNSYRQGSYGMGYNSYGDGWLIYRDNTTIYDSLRWENLREGQEDYEMMWLLNATLNELDAENILEDNTIANYRNQLNELVLSIAGDRLNYTKDVTRIYDARLKIGNFLHELSNYIDIDAIGERAWYPPSAIEI